MEVGKQERATLGHGASLDSSVRDGEEESPGNRRHQHVRIRLAAFPSILNLGQVRQSRQERRFLGDTKGLLCREAQGAWPGLVVTKAKENPARP